MKKLIFTFCTLIISKYAFSQTEMLAAPVAPLIKNVTRIDIWGSDGDGVNQNNILRFGAGITIAPTPASVRDTTNIVSDTIQLQGKLYAGRLDTLIDTLQANGHKFKRTYTRLHVDTAKKRTILRRISKRKKSIEDHCSITIGYENIETKVKIDSAISSPPISGFYLGGFYTVSFKKIACFVGATMGIYNISNGTATLGPPNDPFPVKFSSSPAVSPQFNLGVSFFKGIVFLQASYKYLKFSAITYVPANTGVLSQTEYVMLPAQISLSSYYLTLGLSIPLNFSNFGKK